MINPMFTLNSYVLSLPYFSNFKDEDIADKDNFERITKLPQIDKLLLCKSDEDVVNLIRDRYTTDDNGLLGEYEETIVTAGYLSFPTRGLIDNFFLLTVYLSPSSMKYLLNTF